MTESKPICFLVNYGNRFRRIRRLLKNCNKAYFKQETKSFAKVAGVNYETAVRVILGEHKVEFEKNQFGDNVYIYF